MYKMTTEDWENKSINEICYELESFADNIHSRDTMLSLAKHHIDDDNLFLAIHILQGLNEEYAEYYDYDMCMGTLESVTAITSHDDIEQYVELID